MKGLGPVSSREAVLVHSFIEEGREKFYLGSRSIEDYPCSIADENAVRADIIVSGMIFEALGEGNTLLTAFNDFDPKGMIPEFLKNMMAKSKASDIVQLEGLISSSQ